MSETIVINYDKYFESVESDPSKVLYGNSSYYRKNKIAVSLTTDRMKSESEKRQK